MTNVVLDTVIHIVIGEGRHAETQSVTWRELYMRVHQNVTEDQVPVGPINDNQLKTLLAQSLGLAENALANRQVTHAPNAAVIVGPEDQYGLGASP